MLLILTQKYKMEERDKTEHNLATQAAYEHLYIYIYIYIYISAVKQFKINVFVYICRSTVYMYYVYINTHPCMYIFKKKYVMIIY